ncbi:glycosyltransferase [Amycolatopsis sp. Hca4]|uniref:glycosyltransferase n=1 Tax=Amycolatopsis sp. Hca4 TaxID=2742131 RepID=UPI0015927CF3|nr:glycosyltransferase [Amycolatopsis sp. Hca4]QKV73662.1 glycosyltransferase family 1 protein [Amycolatopsis sp. Hca4]
MRVLLSTYGSRGDVEPLVGLAVRARERGAQVRVCAPPDFAERLAAAGVELVPVGWPVRPVLHGVTPPPAGDRSRRVAELIAAQFDALAAAAHGCDALVAAGLMPVAARSVAEKLGLRYRYASYCPVILPSPHHSPVPFAERPFPPEASDPSTRWELDARNYNAVFGAALNAHRAAMGLPAVDDVRRHVLTDRPWLAADPVLAPWPRPSDLDVGQTGAWILPDDRPLPEDVTAFLDAGDPPVYVGFGSMRAPAGVAKAAIEAIRARGRRVVVGRGWADLSPVDDGADCCAVGEVNLHALFARSAAVVHHGGAGTTTVAARAGVPQVVVAQMVDQPYWAGRVAELGIGVAHEGPTPTVDSLSSALDRALAPGTAARAREVAAAMRTDGATVAASWLLDPAGVAR